mgnify:CR=1 FL=1
MNTPVFMHSQLVGLVRVDQRVCTITFMLSCRGQPAAAHATVPQAVSTAAGINRRTHTCLGIQSLCIHLLLLTNALHRHLSIILQRTTCSSSCCTTASSLWNSCRHCQMVLQKLQLPAAQTPVWHQQQRLQEAAAQLGPGVAEGAPQQRLRLRAEGAGVGRQRRQGGLQQHPAAAVTTAAVMKRRTAAAVAVMQRVRMPQLLLQAAGVCRQLRLRVDGAGVGRQRRQRRLLQQHLAAAVTTTAAVGMRRRTAAAMKARQRVRRPQQLLHLLLQPAGVCRQVVL